MTLTILQHFEKQTSRLIQHISVWYLRNLQKVLNFGGDTQKELELGVKKNQIVIRRMYLPQRNIKVI